MFARYVKGLRLGFVDYDGQTALAHWRANRPITPEQEEAFVREHCPLIVEGVANLASGVWEILK